MSAIDWTDRFWSKVRREESGCWLWTAGTSQEGRGLFMTQKDGNVRVMAHRHAYALTHGPIAASISVGQRCGDRACVNPAHLVLDPKSPPEPRADPSRIDWSHLFWRHVAPEALSGCWLWMGTVDSHVYGHVVVAKRRVRAHRRAFALVNGPIPDGMQVCHRCDVTLCVNPDHLWLGTNAENTADKVAKGRSPRGAENAASKVAAHVEEIRARVAAGETQASVARAFGVCGAAISRIVHRQNYREAA